MGRIDADSVREAFAAFGRGDVESVSRWICPETKWEENHVGGFPGLDPVYIGLAGLRKWMQDTHEAWDAIESLVDEIEVVETSEGPSFIATTRLVAKGRQDIEVGWTLYNVFWTNRDHLLRRRVYFDQQEARTNAALTDGQIERSEATP